ncbi:MAG: hypothetical protein GXO45_01470 [Aquificae bacterium]|nr:hypothetical protein [Aquificota bacterium]
MGNKVGWGRILRVIRFILPLFLLSCENFYSKVYDEKIKNQVIPCVSFEKDGSITSLQIAQALTEEGIKLKENCPYKLKAVYKFLSQCNNPTAKSVGADFDGFLRFDLTKEGKLLYRCQMDWKGEFNKDRIKSLIKKMKGEIKFSED